MLNGNLLHLNRDNTPLSLSFVVPTMKRGKTKKHEVQNHVHIDPLASDGGISPFDSTKKRKKHEQKTIKPLPTANVRTFSADIRRKFTGRCGLTLKCPSQTETAPDKPQTSSRQTPGRPPDRHRQTQTSPDTPRQRQALTLPGKPRRSQTRRDKLGKPKQAQTRFKQAQTCAARSTMQREEKTLPIIDNSSSPAHRGLASGNSIENTLNGRSWLRLKSGWPLGRRGPHRACPPRRSYCPPVADF